MATFGEIQTRVHTLLIDTPTAIQTLSPVFINDAIRRCQRKHNFKVMEATYSGVTVSGQRALSVARPALWKEARKSYGLILPNENGMPQQVRLISSAEEALAAYGDDADLDVGYPKQLFENDANATFDVYPYPDGLSDYPDGEYRIQIPYWTWLADLSSNSDTNWFTQWGSEYVTYAATAYGFYANEDEDRGNHWMALAEAHFKELIQADKRRRIADTDTLMFNVGAKPPRVQE